MIGMGKKYITIKEAAELMNRTSRMVYRYTKDGRLSLYKILGSNYVDEEEVIELMKPVKVS